jgi:predicted nucleic acid-binding protein
MRRSGALPPATRLESIVENEAVARFVIDSGATLQLASAAVEMSSAKELYAPTLWRSEILSALYEVVRRGELSEDDARARLAYVNALKIRLLGDSLLRRRAWEIARQLDLATTYQAEYVALAQLQKCTLVSTDASFLKRVGDLVPTAPLKVLT